MRSHHRIVRRLRTLALALAAIAALAPAAALANKIGDTPADFGKPVTPAARIGDTPADFATGARWTALARYYATAGAKVGDTPVDFPGASRAPQYEAPRTISIVRPERTVVRDVNQLLPIVLSSAALLLALGGVGIVLARTGTPRRRLAGRTH
jgi:hypothetical protein